ncbi:GNAT family N-acetyltransferase [Pelagibius sp. Alg239-R121]|uniref:GNAT family N-acetyltransferase n=1 Tax=Pelagibius sp. Alg239-R121 TaxID=2993448 RepID=UPI0024A79516|nr:GNAT family protein [Pelagibius sp. Alg239-R121]
MDGVQKLSFKAAKKWVENLRQHPCAWTIEHENRFIGELRFDAIDNHDRRARLATGIYNPEKLGNGLGREAIRIALQYAFTTMNLHRIALRVIDYNERAIRCYKSVGFVEEGRERETAFIKGEWCDDLIMGLLSHEFLTHN